MTPDDFELPPLLPLTVCGPVAEYAAALEARALVEPDEAHRLTQVAFVLRSATSTLCATRWTVDPPGRCYLYDDPIQGIPKAVRHLLGAPEGCVFVAADWRGAHLHIAKRWSGDEGLTSYDWLADQLGVERSAAKIAALAFINGAGAARIQKITGVADGYDRLFDLLPGVVELWQQAFALHAAPGSTAKVTSLSGRRREIPKAEHEGGWRRLLSALWTATEAEAMAWVLGVQPATLVCPLFDGLLVACAEDQVGTTMLRLDEAMREGAWRAGVDLGVKIGAGRTWAEAEGLTSTPVGVDTTSNTQ